MPQEKTRTHPVTSTAVIAPPIITKGCQSLGKEEQKWECEMENDIVCNNKFLSSHPLLVFHMVREVLGWLYPLWAPRCRNYSVVSYSSLSCTRVSSLYCSRGGVREQSTARIALRILRSRTCRSQAG